ncbi:MAG: M6 family metalloprotease domain-containing protein [Muribaculaceae bacterium]|nr:M6 family metalloprotease domain-containing protein [Muribaculaceae bacterium]
MKKLLILSLAAIFACGAAYAVPAKPVTRTITQSDGSTIALRTIGDEFHHGIVTADGLKVERADNGDFCYVTSTGISNVVAHEASARNAVEKNFIEARRAEITFDSNPSKAAIGRKVRANAARKATQVPTLNSPKIPIILVKYKDIKFRDADPVETYENQFNKADISCYNYFVDQSNGKFTPQFDIMGVVPLTKNRVEYGGNKYVQGQSIDKGVGTMVAEAVKALKDDVDFSQYDNDGDGEVDVVVVLYAGVGEATSNVSNSVWPMQWELSDAYNYGCSDTPAFEVDGVTVDKFAVFNEMHGMNDWGQMVDKIDGIGTFCHEFSHCLGLPDFYDTNYGGHIGMSYWSLLDTGCYGNDGYTPCGYSSYEKNFMGWMDLSIPKEDSTYTIEAQTSHGAAYKIVNTKDASGNEYYILENRQQEGWDEYLPSHGMMAIHVTYNKAAWDGNYVNNYDMQRMTIIPADNNFSTSTLEGDLYPYKGNNSITDTSTPAAKVNTGGLMGKPITDITEQDGKITFTFMEKPVPPPTFDAPELTAATDTTTTSFTANWTPIDEERLESYTLMLKLKKIIPGIILEETFPEEKFVGAGSDDISSSLDDYMDNAGWTGSRLFRALGGIRLGNSRTYGELITPELDYGTAEKITVAFDACTYGSDSKCDLVVGGDTLNIPDGNVKSYQVVIDATDKVTFATTTKSKRVVLSSIRIYQGEVDAIDEAPLREVTVTGDSSLLTITGIVDTTYTVTDLVEGGTYFYMVKAVYVDGESAWSKSETITLLSDEPTPPDPLIGDVNGDGEIDVKDVTMLIAYILGDSPEGFVIENANVNQDPDGEIDVQDVTALINMILE